ncbi:Clp protease N-terminal domain-containing protein [Nonomuraea diastatica]|uniref:Clp R domain-containing protein n=1 Tax=Nonomuraea diastatica TaxID=1848329 RepID=A0A4R4X5B9_9ACTN|nr:Clp protease N-terminal domain-containing protein [Nonomuraea diastatica]TDD25556.1 hypothetical protein E1294_02925 [Nonomuraea diastatica]
MPLTRQHGGGLLTHPRKELARREATGLGHRYVGTEHLLLGLLHDDGSQALGVGLRQTRDQVIKVLHGDL